MESILQEVFNSLRTAGPIVLLLLYLWQSERKERLKLQDERDTLLERTLKGLNDTVVSLTANTSSIESLKDLTLSRRHGPDV